MIKQTGMFVSLVAGLMLAFGLGAASAQAPSLQDQIEKQLQPKSQPGLTRSLGGGTTRSMNADPKAAEQQQFINRLRSIAVEPTAPPPPPEERAKIAEIVKEKPSIDLEIYFDYNSAEIGPKALPALIALGNVLSKDDFKGIVFFINGHTDAAGSAEYNQVLSQRRAAAVRKVLIEQYKLAPDTLVAVGFGKEQLKHPGNPLAPDNRRVQIVNTEVKATAGR
jgi:outer membrane protein OmpA-like peptidoglycan-associated protein